MSPQAWTSLKIRILDLAEIIDAHRVFPKIFVFGYGAICWHMTLWYEALDAPSIQQSGFVGVVVSVFAPLFKWYAEGGRRWNDDSRR